MATLAFTKLFLRKKVTEEDGIPKDEKKGLNQKKETDKELEELQDTSATRLYNKFNKELGDIKSVGKRLKDRDKNSKKNYVCCQCLCCCCICERRKCLPLICCFVLNACNSFIVNIIDSGLSEFGYKRDLGKSPTRHVQRTFNGVRLLATLLGVLLSLKTNCRVVSIGGCVLTACSLFIASWLNKKLIGIIGFLVGGIAGIGSSFIKLASIVPILEEFGICRFMAVAFVNVGGICGDIVYFVLVGSGWLFDDLNIYWKNMYRWQLVAMALAFVASLGLRPSNKKWIEEYFSPFDWKLFKRITLYLLMAALFFSQFGHYPLSRRILVLYETDVLSALGVFLYYAGQILGPTFLFCCIKKKLLPSLFVMGVLSVVAGVWTMVTASTMTDTGLSIYGGALGLAKAAFETLLQNGIPTAFGVKHVRLVKGLLDLGAGVGILVSDPASEAAESAYGEEEYYKATFYLAGVMLIMSAISIVVCIVVVKKIEPIKPEKETTSSDVEDDNDNDHVSDENDNDKESSIKKKNKKKSKIKVEKTQV